MYDLDLDQRVQREIKAPLGHPGSQDSPAKTAVCLKVFWTECTRDQKVCWF